MTGTPKPVDISTRRDRIATLARQMPGVALKTLAHHMDLDWLREAMRCTRKDGATGVDGQTFEEYAANLDANLEDLLNRAKSGTYHAPPVRRVHIPKGKGKLRPLGIPTLEDKVLQRAVLMLLEPVYEQDFMDCSHGFRRGRSPHGALEPIWKGVMDMHGAWVLDVDVKGFFDNLDHRHLQQILRRRVRDGVVVRLIGKWLNAGVMEKGVLTYPDSGTPQGGVISPLLANIYLHEVLDKWFEEIVKPRLTGKAFLIRFADDFVICFSSKGDAQKVMEVLPKRLQKYGLEIHPEKTRLVEFYPSKRRKGPRLPGSKSWPRTFDFLGFTHYWGVSRKGRWIVKRKTSKDRLARAVERITKWLRQVCFQERIRKHHPKLVQKMRGHYAYYGVTGNAESLKRFYYLVRRLWRKMLSRRSQKAYLSWEKYERKLKYYPLPEPVVVHSIYAAQRNRGPRSRMR